MNYIITNQTNSQKNLAPYVFQWIGLNITDEPDTSKKIYRSKPFTSHSGKKYKLVKSGNKYFFVDIDDGRTVGCIPWKALQARMKEEQKEQPKGIEPKEAT